MTDYYWQTDNLIVLYILIISSDIIEPLLVHSFYDEREGIPKDNSRLKG